MNFLVDLDDVVVDTTREVLRIYNKEPIIGEWDKIIGLDSDLILKSIDTFTFWQTLPKMKHADELIEFISAHTDKWAFFSKPTENPESWAGKASWIKLNYPQYLDRLTLGRIKERYGSHQHCLIDDRRENIDAFRRHGGMAIPFPSMNGHFPWTPGQMKDPVSVVRREFYKMETGTFYKK